MGDPVRLLLTNAAAAGAIALVAWGASRVLRRHAVVHALWLLALLKLVSPPIAPLPLLPAWPPGALALAPRTPTVAVIPAPLGGETSIRVRPQPPGSLMLTTSTAARASTKPLPAPARLAPAGPRWRLVLWALLASGALAVAALAAVRFRRFATLLVWARPAPVALAERASQIAAALGVRRAPPVLLLPAPIPPMLWPGRRGPLLLLPQSLLAGLRPDELDTLLAHELAHVRRRDHWVRLVELGATSLFWWYPVTWWARRGLRRVEERCCDEWVLRVLPGSAQAYASGLVKSVAFLAGGPVPAIASGLGPVEDLEARLKEILMTRPVPQLAVSSRVALAAAAVLGLAVFPTHAQPGAGGEDPARNGKAPTPAAAAPAAPEAPPAPAPAPAKIAPRAKRVPSVPSAASTPAAAQPPTPPAEVVGGVPGGVIGGVPGGAVAGVPGGVIGGVPGALAPVPPTPPAGATPASPPAVAPLPPAVLPGRPALAPPPPVAAMGPLGPVAQAPAAPVVAAPRKRADPEHRALAEQRRAIEDQQRKLRQLQIELEQKHLELQAKAEQEALKAEADRLRADGKADEALQLEKRARLSSRRVELQRRELELEVESAALEAKLEGQRRAYERAEAGEADGEERAMEEAQLEVERAEAAREHAEQELETKQKSIQDEMEQVETEEQSLAAEEQVRSVLGSTEELARSIAEQIAWLKQARAEAPAQRAQIDREIQRLQAALDALGAPGPKVTNPASPPSKTPRP